MMNRYLLLALGLLPQMLLEAPEPRVNLGPWLEREVRFRQEVHCDIQGGAGWLSDVEVRVAIPQSSERQEVSDLRFEPAPARVISDRWGNRIAIFRADRVLAGQPLVVGWRCRARIRSITHRVRPAEVRPLAETPSPIATRFLGGGRQYDLNAPDLRAAARTAAGSPRDALDLAFRLNEFVREKLTYVNDGYWESARHVLDNGHGSCSEYNFLFVSLCRLNSLPARYVGATALRSDGDVYEDTIHHRWSEVYLPGHGWFPVDVSRNDGEDGAPVNRSFGHTDRGLLVLMKGDGGEGEPLRWGYVAEVEARTHGGARLRRPKRFTWIRPEPEVDSSTEVAASQR